MNNKYLSVSLSVHIGQLGCQQKELHKVSYLRNFFPKSINEIYDLLKSDNING